MKPSDEQIAVIESPAVPLSVTACAGSGKTRTAVHRMAVLRSLLPNRRARAVLLSFSNVAVETFRQDYAALATDRKPMTSGSVEIDTLDGFFTAHLLRPHAFRTMKSSSPAFLVTGGEPFLQGFTVSGGTFPLPVKDIQVGFASSNPSFYYVFKDKKIPVDPAQAISVVNRLGRTGAYTHDLGRYWCYRTLLEQPGITRALIHRYPQILIDEAQDIGELHQAILELLVNAGSKLSLIGDCSQGIYEFAGANGSFLSSYKDRKGVETHALTKNYRSVPKIVQVANRLCGRSDSADRQSPETHNGAFVVGYSPAEIARLTKAFEQTLLQAGLTLAGSVVICRQRKLANELQGSVEPPGQGCIKLLTRAAIMRDGARDYEGAFRSVTTAISVLVTNLPKNFLAHMTEPFRFPEARPVRRMLWEFTRTLTTGLPDANLDAKMKWHPLLLQNIKLLLERLRGEHGFSLAENIGQKLSQKGLSVGPLIGSTQQRQAVPRIRADTVHGVKGEGLEAVLYIASKEHAKALLGGVSTELGRIGYVAVTRARDLFWLGVPSDCLEELRPLYTKAGFEERH